MAIPLPQEGQPPQTNYKKYMLYGPSGWKEGMWHPDYSVWAAKGRTNVDGYPEDGWLQVYRHEQITAFMDMTS